MKTGFEHWRRYFENNAQHRTQIPWHAPGRIDEKLSGPLIHSLQRFQVGESGGSGCLQRAAQKTGDADYIAAIELFAAEEAEHGRLLAQMLERLGAPLLQSHWSDNLFIVLRRIGGRRLSGLCVELMTLLIAEMIAKRYYRALYEGSDDEALRAMCAQILRDEIGHVSFHCDFLHEAFARVSPARRVLARATWKFFYRAACYLVLFDHRGVFKATGVSAREWLRSTDLIFRITAAQIFGAAPKRIAMERAI
jgi:hypothetical protein